MTLTLPRAPRRAAAVLAALTLAPLAGCGGDDAGPAAAGDGLARLAPSTVPVYAEAAVRPSGQLGEDVDAMIKRFAPDQSLEKLIASAFSSTDKVSYETDVKPWLGERAGIALTAIPDSSQKDPNLAVFVQTTDGEKALDFVRKAAGGPVKDLEYAGVKYLSYRDGRTTTNAAIVDDTLVVGTEKGFKASIDASEGDGLATNPDYVKTVEKVSDGSAAIVYADVAKAFEAAVASEQATGNAKQLEGLRELLNRREVKSAAAGLKVTGDAVKVATAAQAKAGADNDKVVETVAALPAGAWAAAGLGDIGRALSEGLDSLNTVGGPGFDLQEGLEQLKQQAGIDVQKDLLSWMGQGGLFVRGASITDVGGALVVQSKDPSTTKAALAKVRTIAAGAGVSPRDVTVAGVEDGFSFLIPGGVPVELFAVLKGDRFALAVGRPALEEALEPSTTLADDDTYKAAADTLGDGLKPTFLLDVPKVAGLIGLAAGNDPNYAQAKQYLDKIGTVSAGAEQDGDLAIQTLAVQVK